MKKIIGKKVIALKVSILVLILLNHSYSIAGEIDYPVPCSSEWSSTEN